MQQIELTTSFQNLEPGLWIYRYVSHASVLPLVPCVSLSVAPIGEGCVDFLPGEGVVQNTLRRPGDCIVVRVQGGSAGLQVTEYHTRGETAQALIRLDRVETNPDALSGRPTMDMAQTLSSGTDNPELKLVGHIEQRGDVTVKGGWLGDPNGLQRIEGFAVIADNLPDGVTLGYAIRSEQRPNKAAMAGSFVGSRGKAEPINAITFNLGGPRATACQIIGEARFSDGSSVTLVSDQEATGRSDKSHLVALRIRIEEAVGSSVKSPWDDPAIAQIFKA